MIKRHRITVALLAVVTVSIGWTYYADSPAEQISEAAQTFLASLDDEQKSKAIMPYDSEQQVDWHFIPKKERKGAIYSGMNGKQKKAAMALMASTLSKMGYEKTTTIMALEGVLHELEKANPGRFARDPEKYYFTVFGDPAGDSKWGLSIEGHHLSLNFVLQGDDVVSSTPTVLCANPTIVSSDIAGIKKGTRVLKDEEVLAFELVNSLDDDQKKTAIFAEEAPREVRNAGEAQPPVADPVGIAYKALSREQQQTLEDLVDTYAYTIQLQVGRDRIREIVEADPDKIYFGWAGALKPGIGHYYRIQGPTFLIEFVNTQPDAAGNPASHIHAIWRDVRGDFAISIK